MRPDWYGTDPDRIGFTDHLAPMHASPLAFAEQVEMRRREKAGERRKRLASQRVGCATHALLLEGGAAFRRGYVVTDVVRNEAHAAYQEVLRDAGGKTVLSVSEYEKARSIAPKVRAHPWVARFLDGLRSNGWRMVVEQPLRWSEPLYLEERPAVVPAGVDPWQGIEQVQVKCRGIVDAVAVSVAEGRGVIVDAKEVPTTNLRPLFAHLEKRLYHVQAAQYLAGCRAQMPALDWSFVWLAYEGRPPHDTVLVQMSEEDEQYGATVRTDLLRRIVQARRTGEYPGRHTEVVASSLPAWETRNDDIEEVF